MVVAGALAALADSAGGLKSALSEDGVHPNPAGYAAMKPLARQSLMQALGRR